MTMNTDEELLKEIRLFQNKNKDLWQLLNNKNLTYLELDRIMVGDE